MPQIVKKIRLFWMLEHQLTRRNLQTYQRTEIILKYTPILHKSAAKLQPVVRIPTFGQIWRKLAGNPKLVLNW